MPEVEAELRGVSDVSSLRVVLSSGDHPEAETDDNFPGSTTRSRTAGARATFVTSVKATASLSKGELIYLSATPSMSTGGLFVLGSSSSSSQLSPGAPKSLSRFRSLIRRWPVPPYSHWNHLSF